MHVINVELHYISLPESSGVLNNMVKKSHSILAFGKQAEKLIGVTIPELISVSSLDKMVLPPPVAQLKGETKTLQVGLTAIAIDTNTNSFKLFDFDDNRRKKRKAESSTAYEKINKETKPTIPLLPAPAEHVTEHAMTPTTQPSQELSSKPINKQVSRV